MYYVDSFYLFKSKFKKYNLIPNNIFFQKSNINSTSNQKGLEIFFFCKCQYFYTGRNYYQYDPKFVSFWEPVPGITVLSILIIIIIIIALTLILSKIF